MRFAGGCHCGNVTVLFETCRDPKDLPTRACDCTFCRRYQARTVIDREGRAEIAACDASLVSRYRFGLGTAEFIICSRCGVYLGAVLAEAGGCWATINVNALDQRDAFPLRVAVSYEGESAEARRARRRANWTPARVRLR